jgi:hypothetical protein
MWTRRLSELALAGCLGLVASNARAEPSPASDDGLAEYRERFKQGMDLYEHGAAADAVAVWEPIYRDLGEPRGYRLAYDLGVAYAALDDTPHSADRLQAFLNEVDSRRARGEPLGASVTNEESDARARLARFAAVLGRVQVVPSGRPSVVRVDAGDPRAAGTIAWVTPGPHAVTFDPQTVDQRTIAIDVAAGALMELVPPPLPARPGSPLATSGPPSSAPAPGSMPPAALAEPPAPLSAPFPPALIAISGAVALATAGAAVALEIYANHLRDDDVAEQARSADGTIPAADRASFATARTWAYVATGSAAGLAGVTAGLTAWYFLGKTHGEGARPSPGVGVRLENSRVVVEGSF